MSGSLLTSSTLAITCRRFVLQLASRRPRRLHLPRAVVAQWMMQLLQALEHLHGHGIIHRDVKTANLFLTKNGFLKLGDFGVAKVLARNASAVGGRTTATPLGTSCPLLRCPTVGWSIVCAVIHRVVVLRACV